LGLPRLGAREPPTRSLSARSFIAAAREGRPGEIPDLADEAGDVQADHGPDLVGLAQGIGSDGQPDLLEPDAEAALAVEELAHGAARAPVDNPFLDRHDRPPRLGEPEDGLAVEGLDEAGVDDGEREAFLLQLPGRFDRRRTMLPTAKRRSGRP
jgi:hypothetical protein